MPAQFIEIVHPVTGARSRVAESSFRHLAAKGWRRSDADDALDDEFLVEPAESAQVPANESESYSAQSWADDVEAEEV